MPTSSAVVKNLVALNLAILVSNVVLCRGLDVVLRTLPNVRSVSRCVNREQASASLSSERFDVVIVAAADMDWLKDPRLAGATADSRVLVLVDESTADAVAFSADGVLFQQDLSIETLRNALRPNRTGGPVPVTPLRPVPAVAPSVSARTSISAPTSVSARTSISAPTSVAAPKAVSAPTPVSASTPVSGSTPVAADAPPTRSRPVSLTSREVEALTLLVKGMSNKQIARRLAISGHGAKRLVASILLKLDSPNRTTAAVAAIKAGIIDCP